MKPAHEVETSRVLDEVFKERMRQVEVEGFGPERDDGYVDGGMGLAAAAYAIVSAGQHQGDLELSRTALRLWPWDMSWWKPRSPRNNLVRAAALLIAEIERLDRKAARRG